MRKRISRTSRTINLSHNTKLTDIVALHGQLLQDMGSRRNYEQLIHVALWSGIGISTSFAIDKGFRITNLYEVFLIFVFWFIYSVWVAFISLRQLQNFDEARALRRAIYSDIDDLSNLKKNLENYPKDRALPRLFPRDLQVTWECRNIIGEEWWKVIGEWWRAVSDVPACSRIAFTAFLLIVCVFLLS